MYKGPQKLESEIMAEIETVRQMRRENAASRTSSHGLVREDDVI